MEQISLGFGKTRFGLRSIQNIWKIVLSVYWIKYSFIFPVPFYAMTVWEEDKDFLRFVLAFVPKSPDLYMNAELIHQRVTVDWVCSAVARCISTVFHSFDFRIVHEVSF